jgi:plasmid stabilization system protein ParE
VKVVITPEAQDELADIWAWDAKERGIVHADRYLDFLTKSIFALTGTYASGASVSTRPDYRFIVIRRRSKGHGHVAVYTVGETQVTVLHVFHTAQDWQARVAEG